MKREAQELKATVQVGKKGVTEEAIRETMEQIEKRGMVKVKFNVDSAGIDEFVKGVSEKGTLIMKTGRTLVFRKRR